MFKSLALLVALASAQITTTDSEVSPFDDQTSNPNCTTGNALACNRANGFWDYNGCTCAFAPAGSDTSVGGDDTQDTEALEEFEEIYEEQAVEINNVLDNYTQNKAVTSAFGWMSFINVVISQGFLYWMYKSGNISLGRGKKDGKGSNNKGEDNWAAAGYSYTQFWSLSYTLWLLYDTFGLFSGFFKWWLQWTPLTGLITAGLFIAMPFTGRSTVQGKTDWIVYGVSFTAFLLSWWTMFRHKGEMIDYIEGDSIVEEIMELEGEGEFQDYGDLPEDAGTKGL